MAIHLEVLAQSEPEIAAAKAVSAQHLVGPAFRNERANLLGVGFHVVGSCHHRSGVFFQLLRNKRLPWCIGRMQQVVAFAVLAITRQFVKARATPDVGCNAPVFFQQLLRCNALAQNRARAQQLYARGQFDAFLAQVHAFDDLIFGAGFQTRHGIVFIEQREVVKDVVLALHHALESMLQDDAHLVRKGRVIADAVGNRAGQDVAVPVFMLQTLAVERGAPRRAAQQKATGLHVTGGPGQVAHALKAKHRVIDIERQHDAITGAVAGSCGNPAAHAAGFVDAFLQDLTLDVFLVIHHLLFIDRRVLLAGRVVNTDLAKQALHAEGAGFIDQNRHHARAERLVAQQGGEKTHIGLRRRYLAPLGGRLHHRLEHVQRRHGKLLVGLGATVRQVAAQRLAPLVQVAHLGRIVSRLVERNIGDLAVGHRDVKAVTEDLDVFIGELLGLVHIVLALAALAHAKTLDGFDQQYGRLTHVLDGGMVSGIDLLRVVSATAQRPDVIVAHLGHHLRRLRVSPKEILAHVGAVVGLERLVVTVERVHHQLVQRTVLVTRQQRVPVAAPQQFDDVPAGTTKLAFELLNDLAVAAHRAVQPLQVAVDDKNQVVQLFPRRHADGTAALDLVHLAVTTENPDFSVRGIGNATCVQVLQKARLVDRHQRPQAHRHGRELPEFGHQLRVRITGQTLAPHFLAKVEQLLFTQAPLHIGPGIDTGCHMTLNVEAVTSMVFAFGVPEVVKAGTKHVGQRRERPDVPTEIAAIDRVMAVGLDHHRHRVPAHVGAQPLLDFDIAGAALFFVGPNRIDVAGGGRKRHVDVALTRVLE